MERKKEICDACAKALVVGEACEDVSVRLTELKECKPGALKKLTNDVFFMMLQAEMMFRGIDEQVLLAQKDLKAVIVRQAEENCTQIVLPTCHNVRKKFYLDTLTFG